MKEIDRNALAKSQVAGGCCKSASNSKVTGSGTGGATGGNGGVVIPPAK